MSKPDLTIIQAYAPQLVALMPVAHLRRFLASIPVTVAKTMRRPELVALALEQIAARPEALHAYFAAVPEHLPLMRANQFPFPASYPHRKLLAQSGHLTIGQTTTARLYGQDVTVPLYSALDVFALDALGEPARKMLIKQLQAERRKTPAYQAELAAKKQRQAQLKLVAAEFWAQYDAFLMQIAPWAAKERALLTLAFWTQQINQLQKYWQLRASLRRRPQADYYAWKDQAIDLFHQSQAAIVTTGFTRPEDPDRLEIDLCAKHFTAYLDDTQRTLSISEYYDLNQQELTACPNCAITVHKDYYAHYVTEIAVYGVRFVFHTPYTIGRNLFGDPRRLRQLAYQPNATGPFAFGHAADADLVQAVGETALGEHFQQALKEATRLVTA